MSERMRSYTPFVIWAYLLAATVVETFLSVNYWRVSIISTDALIFALAWSQAATVAAFFMHLRYEVGGLKIFVIVPAIFVITLIIGLLLSLGVQVV